MAEKVNIASLTIDFNDVIKKSAEYKKQIDGLKAAQKELDTTTEAGAQQFAKNEATLRNLSKAYRDNQQFAAALEEVNKDLEKSISTENKSTQELRDSRSRLNQISKNIKGDTQEEKELRDKLNKAIDDQTNALRGQSSEFNSSKDQIGEYKQNIIAAFEEMEKNKQGLIEQKGALEELRNEQEKGSDAWNFYNTQINNTQNNINILVADMGELNDEMEQTDIAGKLLSGDFKGIAEAAKESGGASGVMKQGLKGVANGFLQTTKAALGFIATPIGAVLAALVLAFLLIKNAMDRNEESMNKIRKAFSAFGGITKGLLKLLEPLGKFLIDGLVKGFELVEKGIFKAMEGIAAGLDFLGFDDAAKELRGFTSQVAETVKKTKELTEAEIELEKAQRLAEKTQLDFQKRAEKLRQARDDESKTIKDRIKANEELGAVLKEQLNEELKIAQKALEVSKLRIQTDGETKEALEEQAEALTKIAEIEERITGQASEQLTNRVALQKEGAEKLKELQEKAIDRQQQELDLFIAQQGVRAKTLEEELEIQKRVSEKAIEIKKAELEAKKISELEYNAAVIEIRNELLQAQADLTVANAQRELEEFNRLNQSKIDGEKFLSEQLFNEERARLERLAEQRREFEALRLEEGVISQTEYNEAINLINEENRIANEELEAERKAAREEQEAIDLENKMIAAQEQFDNEFAIRQQQLEQSRQLEVQEAEKTGASIDLINKKYAAFDKTLQKDLTEFKNQQNAQILSGIKGLFNEGSTLGKAFAIAEITTNTIQNASKAFTQAAVFASNPFTAPLAVNANIQGGIIIATGAAQAAKVAGVRFAQGGILQGASHANGGIPTEFGELEGGEAVINKRSTAMFAPLLSRINEAGGGVKFARGGVLGAQNVPQESFDYDLFAERVAEANSSLPSPVVSVEEIAEVSNNVSVLETDSEL